MTNTLVLQNRKTKQGHFHERYEVDSPNFSTIPVLQGRINARGHDRYRVFGNNSDAVQVTTVIVRGTQKPSNLTTDSELVGTHNLSTDQGYHEFEVTGIYYAYLQVFAVVNGVAAAQEEAIGDYGIALRGPGGN